MSCFDYREVKSKAADKVLTLSEPARKKILAKTRRLRRSLAHQLDHARPP